MKALNQIFDYLKSRTKSPTNKSFNAEVVIIRRSVLTPTRLLLLPPQPTLKSRFIVESNPDFTLRLTVREDDLKNTCFTVRKNQTNFLKGVIKTRIINNIRIDDQVFEFLSTSSSQLRDSGMVLYAKDESRTASSIRESIGDMSEIRRNVAKYVAQLGLTFSQVMTHIIVEKDLIEVKPHRETINQFKGEHNCVLHLAERIDNYLAQNFYYKEPVFDESITSDSDRRHKIIEERIKAAEVLLKAWLERQDHLFFKSKISNELLSFTDGVMSGMDRKLTFHLMRERLEIMNESIDELRPLRSVGDLVMSFMKDLVENWLSINNIKDNNRIVGTHLVKFGF
jgi:hypothetical protein